MLDSQSIGVTISRLDAWLDGMRCDDGYGGPVAHWWRDSLLYCGAGLDWRYEGIICGYITLFDRTGDSKWLVKARRAADDLVNGQLPDGRYRNSSFEGNPLPGGTPHEAAADVGLLVLVGAMRSARQDGWQVYLDAAERNLFEYHIESLWDQPHQRFSDGDGTFVPNKAATIIEALCRLAEVTGDGQGVERLVVSTADAILAHQVRRPGNTLDGAISQATIKGRRVDQFFPYYVARCIPGLIAAFQALGHTRYLEAARAAATFLDRARDGDGAFPQVVYQHGRTNRYPRWVAATGDIIRVLELLRPLGIDVDLRPTTRWLIEGQLPTGGVRIAAGFSALTRQRETAKPPDVRDFLPVVGWNDKAFHGLTALLPGGSSLHAVSPAEVEHRTEATWRSLGGHGQRVLYREDSETVEVTRGAALLYSWRKGEAWATVRSPRS
jgi:uncharacterized protein YyaL (SSP411 family)